MGVDHGVLFQPTMTPERMYEQTIKTFFAQGKEGRDKSELNRIFARAFEHLDRFTDEERKARLHPKLTKMYDKLNVVRQPL